MHIIKWALLILSESFLALLFTMHKKDYGDFTYFDRLDSPRAHLGEGDILLEHKIKGENLWGPYFAPDPEEELLDGGFSRVS